MSPPPKMGRRPELAEAVAPLLKRLHETPAELRMNWAQELLLQLQTLQAEVGASRRAAVRELRAAGWTLARVAHNGGVTVERVRQIQDGSRPRRRSYVPVSEYDLPKESPSRRHVPKPDPFADMVE